MSRIRIRAQAKDGVVDVKALFSHPMESGRRRDDETNELIPAHYITEVVCEHNGRVVLTANWGPAVSRNPLFQFRFKGGAPGDFLRIAFTDNLGQSGEAEVEIL
jgi:sulfur-oxidizing protein SoxZ